MSCFSESYRNDITLFGADRLNCRVTNASSIPRITSDADSVNGSRYFSRHIYVCVCIFFAGDAVDNNCRSA